MNRYAHAIPCLLIAMSIAMPAMGQGKPPIILAGHQGAVGGVGFFPDGKTVATAGFDGTIRIWDVMTGKEIRTLPGSSRGICDIDISRDGRLLASANFNDKEVRVLDVNKGRVLFTHNTGRFVTIVAFSADGKYLLVGDDAPSCFLIDIAAGRKVNSWSKGNRVAMSPDGKYGAFAGPGGKKLGATLHLLDLRTQKIKWESPHPGSGSYVGFSADSKLVAVGDKAGKVMIRDVATGKKIKSLTVGKLPIDGVAFTRDGRLATGCWDKLVKLWDVKTGRLLHTFSGHTNFVLRIAVSPDGSKIISASTDGTARIWTIPDAPPKN